MTSPLSVEEQLRMPSGESLQIARPVVFLSSATFAELPLMPTLVCVEGSTSPDVLNATFLILSSTTSTLLTNFLSAAENQKIVVLGDGNTTVQNGTNIYTNTGANKLMASNRVYVFYFMQGKWYEQ